VARAQRKIGTHPEWRPDSTVAIGAGSQLVPPPKSKEKNDYVRFETSLVRNGQYTDAKKNAEWRRGSTAAIGVGSQSRLRPIEDKNEVNIVLGIG